VTGWFPRVVVAAAAAQFVIFLVRPVVSYQALEFNATPTQLGLVVASYSVISLCACIPLGRAIDRYGERRFLAAGSLLLVPPLVLLLTVRSLVGLAAASAAIGLAQLLVIVASQTLIARGIDAERRDSRFATFTLMTSITQFAAPAAAGLLVSTGSTSGDASGLHVAYGVALGLTSVVALVSLSLVLAPGALLRRAPTTVEGGRAALAEVLASRSVTTAIVVGFSVLSAADLLVAFMPAYGEMHGIAPRQVGFLLASHGLTAVVARVLLLRLLRRFERRALLVVCLGLAATCLSSVPFVGSLPLLYVCMVGSGFGIGLCQPIAIAWVAGGVRPGIRGMAMSVRMVGNRLGQTVVPLGVAGLAGAVGASAAFLAPAVMLATAGVMVHRSRRSG
jgi:MFS family permease